MIWRSILFTSHRSPTSPQMLRDITTSARVNSEPGHCVWNPGEQTLEKKPRRVRFTEEGLCGPLDQSNRSHVRVGKTD